MRLVETNEWSELSPGSAKPTARANSACAVLDGNLFVVGGIQVAEQFIEDFWVYHQGTPASYVSLDVDTTNDILLNTSTRSRSRSLDQVGVLARTRPLDARDVP